MTVSDPPAPHFVSDRMTVWSGDCIDVLRALPDNSADAVVTDPPYGLGFMGREWDDLPPGLPVAQECLRVLKPGGYILAFGGSRTWHRLATAIEDAGFEIRDSIAWLYGSGFPKSLNLVGEDGERTGWGTALKPAFEPIVVGRNPIAGTVAANVREHGTGALNIEACRVGTDSTRRPLGKPLNGGAYGSNRDDRESLDRVGGSDSGRWPANVALEESQASLLDQQTDSGASRFFPVFRYQAKAAARERPVGADGTVHPTVKPLDLMRWLVRLVTPANGIVIDPFAGSGTTAEACLLEGFRCVAIEREPKYLPLIVDRINRRTTPAEVDRAGTLFDPSNMLSPAESA